jgi:hypothetical protein
MAVSYDFVGYWFDLVRVDSVFVALLFAGAALSVPDSRDGTSRRPLTPARIALCAAVLTAAMFAKQTAVFFLPWMFVYATWRHRRSGLWLTAATGGLCAMVLGALLWATDGRFWTLVFTVMSRHPRLVERSFENALRLLVHAPFILLLPLVVWWLWRRQRLRARSVFWLGMLGCALAASLVTTTKTGAHVNNLITAALLSWPVSLVLLSDLLRPMRPGSAARFGWAAVPAVLAGLLLWWFPFYPEVYRPSPLRWQAARELNRLVRSLPGGVLFPAHSFLPLRNGHHHGQLHRQGYVDAMEAEVRRFDFVQCFGGVEAEWLIASGPWHPYFGALLLTAYEPAKQLPPTSRIDGGGYATPMWIFRRRPGNAVHLQRARRRGLFDFESGSFADWQQDGEAFRPGPSRGQRDGQHPIVGYRGHWLVNSFHPQLQEEATGVLRSAPFVIDRSHLGFRVAGGGDPSLRVELEIDAEVVRVTAGAGKNVDLLGPVAWDVSALRGERARLVITDAATGSWGHLVLDEVELFDVPGQ